MNFEFFQLSESVCRGVKKHFEQYDLPAFCSFVSIIKVCWDIKKAIMFFGLRGDVSSLCVFGFWIAGFSGVNVVAKDPGADLSKCKLWFLSSPWKYTS